MSIRFTHIFTSTSSTHIGSKGSGSRGLTLVETMVAVSIFSVILVFVCFLQGSAFSTFHKTQVQSDTYRMAMLAGEQIKRELLYVQVTQYDVSSASDPVLKYRIPRRETNGDLAVLESGILDWDNDEVSLYLENDGEGNRNIIRRQTNRPDKKLFSLGNEGSIVFSMPEDKRLEASIMAKITSQGAKVRESDYSLMLQFYLPNQEL